MQQSGIIIVRQAGSAAGLVPVADQLTAGQLAAGRPPWSIVIIAFPQTIKTCHEVAAHPDAYTLFAVDGEAEAQARFAEHIEAAAFVLTGTSAQAQEDAYYWRLARRYGVESIGYLDQWANIELRFPGESRADWPDHLAVIDPFDQQLALAIAPQGVRIHVTGSPALGNIQRQVAAIRAQGVRPDPRRFVFATEPVENPAEYRQIHGYNDEDSFALALAIMRRHHQDASLFIRLHPRDRRERWLSKLPADVKIEWDEETRAQCLARSCTVFGMRSFFLLESASCGVRVVSLQPNKKTRCPLTDGRMPVVIDIADYPAQPQQ